MINADNLEITDFNPSASKLVNIKQNTTSSNNGLNDFFDVSEKEKIISFFKKVRESNESFHIETLLSNRTAVTISSSLFKLEKNSFLLVQINPSQNHKEDRANRKSSAVLSAIDNAPDGFVITDEKGEINYVNEAFAEMVNLPNPNIAVGGNFINWLVRGRVDFSVMLKTLYQNGILRLFSTHLSGEGPSLQVEISAVTVPLPNKKLFNFIIRSTGRRLSNSSLTPPQLSRSAEQLSELVGQLPLKDIVDETSDLIEKLCIESALNLTFNNRVSAAEMLGLSRQSLYVKMKKLSIGSNS
jgi:transcriptional regulator PpsR